jgi:hypothetical protein
VSFIAGFIVEDSRYIFLFNPALYKGPAETEFVKCSLTEMEGNSLPFLPKAAGNE